MRCWYHNIQHRRTQWIACASVALLAGFGSIANAGVSGIATAPPETRGLLAPESIPAALAVVPDVHRVTSARDCSSPAFGSLSTRLAGGALTGTNPFLPPQDQPLSRGESRAVRELPPAPGGATVVLSGLLTLIGVGAARSVRHMHLAALPAWYHTGAPDQIGHAVPYDLGQVVLVCWYDCSLLSVVPQPVFRGHPREFDTRSPSQSFLTLVAPRGPPSAHSDISCV